MICVCPAGCISFSANGTLRGLPQKVTVFNPEAWEKLLDHATVCAGGSIRFNIPFFNVPVMLRIILNCFHCLLPFQPLSVPEPPSKHSQADSSRAIY